jgi:hypothetical protein
MLIFIEINSKHELDSAHGKACEPHQPAEWMAKQARHDGSTQTGNAHIPAYQFFAEVLARFPGIEEVPAPLVTEIRHRLGRPIVEDGIISPYKLATLLNTGIEDELVIGKRTGQHELSVKVP